MSAMCRRAAIKTWLVSHPAPPVHHTAATSALLTPVFVLPLLAVSASALHRLLISLSPRLMPPSRAWCIIWRALIARSVLSLLGRQTSQHRKGIFDSIFATDRGSIDRVFFFCIYHRRMRDLSWASWAGIRYANAEMDGSHFLVQKYKYWRIC